MKILFDHQLFSYQKYGGASKYFCKLISCLPREMWDTTTLFSNNQYVEDLNLFNTYHFLPKYYFRGQGRIMNELNKPYSCYRLIKGEYDVFHQTHFETYCLKVIGNKPMVTTFHDINFSTLNPKKKIVSFQKKSLERADKIIAISNNTKKDLMSIFDIDPRKIEVIYHGIDHFKTFSNDKRIIEKAYILYVGTRANHKNFERFIKAYSLLVSKYPDISLVCTSSAFTVEEKIMFKQLNVLKNVCHLAANEETMFNLYTGALFFVFPSLYEGFGLPILESMAAHCPVVLSNSSCFPEIALDAGAYFDPYDVDAIFETMDKVLCDDKYRKELIAKGDSRVKYFSWNKSAQRHIEVYNSLL